MSKLTKNQKLVADKVEAGKAYSLREAAELVKEITTTKFEASVDIDVRLGVDPRKANQMVRGVVSLPNGTGKVTRVLALCTPDQEAAAKEAGADYVGLDEYIEKIKGGSGEPNRKKVASVTWDQVKEIAEDKMPDLNCFTLASAMRMVAGTARSMGITVKGQFPENV